MLLACQPLMAAPPDYAQVQALTETLPFPASFGAHPDFKTEWWYATGWINTADGKPLGYQVTFFRSATAHDRADPSKFAPKQLIIGHAALSDPANGKLLHDQRSAREGFGLAYAKVGAIGTAAVAGRARLFAQGTEPRTGQLLLQRAATENQRQHHARRPRGGSGQRHHLARPRVVQPGARRQRQRLGLDRREPERRRRADGLPDPQQDRC